MPKNTESAACFELSRRDFLLSGVAAKAVSLDRSASAAELLTFIVPFEAGSAPDLYARIVAPEVANLLARTAVVENKPGAAGNIAAEYVAHRPADNALIMIGTAALCEINPLVFDNLRWSMKDFAALAKGVQSPLVLVTNAKVPARGLDELISWAKANPGKLSYASYSIGAPGDFLGAQLNQVFGLDLVAVPYHGSASQINALVAGDSPIGFAQTQNSLPHIKSGALNAIAVTGPDRFRLLPDTPTFRDLKHPEFTSVVWFGLLTQAANAPNAIRDMTAAALKAHEDQRVREPLLAQGYDLPDEGGDAFARSITAGTKHWSAIVKVTGFKASR